MQISVNDPLQQTLLFGATLCVFFICTFFLKKNYTPFSLTQELKGFSILAIIFAHIGYSLSTDPQFLFPFSIIAGVGVNLFLFLSGYGLTYSELQKGAGILKFYSRRLLKLFVPFWIVLFVLFVLDYFVLGTTYQKEYVIWGFFGIFTQADMYTDINSPFWYFSLILFYYLSFPLLFSKRYTWITALLLYLIVMLVVKLDPSFLSGVIGLYQVHMFAFPLGILAAAYLHKLKPLLHTITKIYVRHELYMYPLSLLILCIIIVYVALHANIGNLAYIEEVTSLSIMSLVILLFILKKRESKLLSLFGFFSYEIYLFHWPLVYRYDFLYTHVPPWVATVLYLGVFIVLAFILKKISDSLYKVLSVV